MHRRSILQLLAAAAAALPWRPSLAEAQAAPLGDLGVNTLRAAALAVLPSELGRGGTDKVVDEFLQWLRGYRAGADMGFGYGLVKKRVTPAMPVERFQQQLLALERAGE